MSAISIPTWQDGFLSILPSVQTHAQISFRRLPAHQREELVQESVASACVAYQRLAAQGKLDVACSSSIAAYAVKQARGGRHVGGSQDGAKDPMSAVCQKRHGVSVERFHVQPSGEGKATGWKQVAVEARSTLR